MNGCSADGGWGVALIDTARERLVEIEARLAAVRARAARIVDDTDWRSHAVAGYHRRASLWDDEVRALSVQVVQVRADLARTRRDILERAGWECG